MFDAYTPLAIKAILIAQKESERLGHNFVGTEQILLGLIGAGNSVAATVLGYSLKDVRAEVESIIGHGSGFVAGDIPFTLRAKRVLDNAWNEAKQLDQGYISTEHILLALVHEGEGIACKVLEQLGCDITKVRPRVFNLLNDKKIQKINEEKNMTQGFGKFWMVMVDGGDAPKVRHAHVEDARKEAVRLCSMSRKSTYILEAIENAIIPVPDVHIVTLVNSNIEKL